MVSEAQCVERERVMPSVMDFLRDFFPVRSREPSARPGADRAARIQTFQPVGLQDFLALEVPPREFLLAPILPERSLSMLYAPRGIGKFYRRRQGLPHEQCGRARASRICTWQKVMAIRRLRTRGRSGGRNDHTDYDGQAQ